MYLFGFRFTKIIVCFKSPKALREKGVSIKLLRSAAIHIYVISCESESVCERMSVMFYFMHVMYTHTGPQGEKGELGPSGPPGMSGEKGARGKPGKRVSFSEVL